MSRTRKSAVAYANPPMLHGDDLESDLDLIAFSQLRWNFGWQRPQHLMSRCAQARRVFFIEEPIIGGPESFTDISMHNGVHVVVPRLRDGFEDYNEEMKKLIDEMLTHHTITSYICWYWTPMALSYSRHLAPQITIYDCMEQLSASAEAPSKVRQSEKELLARADLVFTSSQSLYETRRYQHPNIQVFADSIDVTHFNEARYIKENPEDQKNIPSPRLGYYGVIDERIDFDLLKKIANEKQEWHFVLIGPIANVSLDPLMELPNIHYLGPKNSEELPSYLANWDVALLPFARSHATRHISSTRTPEYLAAGRRVVSTSVRDVVRPYGEMKLAHIADSAEAFTKAIEDSLCDGDDKRWLSRVDAFLSGASWDRTWSRMSRLMYQTLKSKWQAHDYKRNSSVSFVESLNLMRLSTDSI